MAHLAVAGDVRAAEGLGAPRWRRLNPFPAFAEALAAEGDRRILWLPVFFGTGIWMLVATIVAVRQALDYRSTARAVGVCALGWVLSVLLAVLLGSLLGPSVS